jgi:hypothetical protein
MVARPGEASPAWPEGLANQSLLAEWLRGEKSTFCSVVSQFHSETPK